MKPGTSSPPITPPPPSNSIKTLAFFDLETTGLPELEFFKTKITEFVIIAVSVEHFLESEELPRVKHKLTLCFNPYKRIDLKSTELTGLTNELLEHENKFDKNAMNLIECFLFKLQQPVCLVAHNGVKFDFPLLKKQYDELSGAFPCTTKVCDSLPVFRRIDELVVEKFDMLKAKRFSLQQWNDAAGDGLELVASIDIDAIFTQPEIEIKQEVVEVKQEGAVDEEFMELVSQELDRLEKNEKSESDVDEIKAMIAANEHTPTQPTCSKNLQPKANGADQPTNRKEQILSRRKLFPETQSTEVVKKQQPAYGKYRLGEIYKRFYFRYPERSHDAESDVVTLINSAWACKKDFVKLMNEMAIDFRDVKKFRE